MARMASTAIVRAARTVPAEARSISLEQRQHMISEAAYYRYAHRGFADGHDVEDWLAAEADYERASRRQLPPRPEALEELGMQHGGNRGPAEDEAMKRILKGHSQRNISRIESMEPEDAPRKE